MQADIFLAGRRYDEAIKQYQKAIELDPNLHLTHYFLGRAYEAKGMYDQAVEEYLKSSALGGMPPETVKKVKEVYTKSGWKPYVQLNLDQQLSQSNRRPLPPFVIAGFYARLDRKDEAIKWLEKGYEERDFRIRLLNVAFEYDSLRSDPKFKELVRRMGLPE